MTSTEGNEKLINKRERACIRQRLHRANSDGPSLGAKREKDRDRKRLSRVNATDEEKNVVRVKTRDRVRRLRLLQTPWKKQQDREKQRDRMRLARFMEAEDGRQLHRDNNGVERSCMTDEEIESFWEERDGEQKKLKRANTLKNQEKSYFSSTDDDVQESDGASISACVADKLSILCIRSSNKLE
ncbi:unnamed protein product [Didymodactylos carnosus]|uniref:Uncharacterized protein n=2 Tax=Didymodactylos carnosus TaxID=1234261 RepID=A0A8S2MHQ1_9BILA|nr:unnamed protein product [Didymodactylos carnosus]